MRVPSTVWHLKKNCLVKSVYFVAEYGTILMSVINSVCYIHIVRLRCPGFSIVIDSSNPSFLVPCYRSSVVIVVTSTVSLLQIYYALPLLRNCPRLWFVTNEAQFAVSELTSLYYKGADKSLARPGRKQVNVSVRMTWISFGALSCREIQLDDCSRLDVVEIARPWHASGFVCFLVGLRT